MLGLHRCVGSSLVAAHRLLIEAPSLVAELRRHRAHGLQQLQHMDRGLAPWLLSTGLAVVVHGLSCTAARGIFSDQGLNPCLLQWQTDSLPLSRQRNPRLYTFTTSIQQYKLGGFSQWNNLKNMWNRKGKERKNVFLYIWHDCLHEKSLRS